MSNRAPILLTDLTAIPVTGSITAHPQQLSAKTFGSAVAIVQMTAAASLVGHNIIFEGSTNSTNGTDGNWFTIQASRTATNTIESSSGVLAGIPAYAWRVLVAGYAFFRIRTTAHTSGTCSYNITRTDFITDPTPASSTTGAQAVSGSLTSAGTTTNTPATPTTITSLSSAATTNLTSVKASAGTMYSAVVSNTGAAAAFVKLYNKASAPVLASDIPVLTIPVPASSVVSLNFGALGHRFATGIAMSITNLAADNDATAVALNQVKVLLDSI